MTEEVVHVVRRTCRKGVKIIAKKVVDAVVGAESVIEAATGAASEVATEAAAQTAAESVVDTAAETLSQSLAEAAAETVSEAAVESVIEAATDSLVDVATQSSAEVAIESLAEAVADVASESLTEAATEALGDSILETATEPVGEALLETITQATSEVGLESTAETATESFVEAAAESVIEAVSETAAAGVKAPITILNQLGIETMNYRQIYQIMAGKSLSDDDYLEPYVASILFLIMVISMGYLLRKLTKTILPGSIQVFFLEFLATMEACSYFFENNNILKHYGYGAFFVAIVLEILVSNRTFEGASENPIKALDEFSRRETTFDVAIVKIAVQALGGLASYRLAQLIWSLDMVYDHRERFFETTCQTDLAVTIVLGFVVEMGAALIDTWIGKQSLSTNSFVDELIKAVNGGAMIIAGVSLTGMYFNPAMATGHMLGCQGTEVWEHTLVYWVGPFVGCILAILLDKVVKVENGLLVQ